MLIIDEFVSAQKRFREKSDQHLLTALRPDLGRS